MKQFCIEVRDLIEVHFSKPVLIFAGIILLLIFTMIGMIVTVHLWFPLLALCIVLYCVYAAYLHSCKVISPERKVLLTNVISNAISYILRRKLPYSFDIPPREVIAKRMSIYKEAGIEIATITLTLMEKDVEDIDSKLLYKVFSDRLYNYCESTPGLGIEPVSLEWTVLSLVDVRLSDMEVVLRIVVADNWQAANFLKSWFKEQSKSKGKRGK